REAGEVRVQRRDARVVGGDAGGEVQRHPVLQVAAVAPVEARVALHRGARTGQVHPGGEQDEAAGCLAASGQLQRRAEGEVAAGGVAREEEAVGRDARGGGGGDGVVERGGEAVLGGEAVVEAEDADAGGGGEAREEVGVGADGADDEAAAVRVDDGGVAGGTVGEEPGAFGALLHTDIGGWSWGGERRAGGPGALLLAHLGGGRERQRVHAGARSIGRKRAEDRAVAGEHLDGDLLRDTPRAVPLPAEESAGDRRQHRR